MLLQQAGHTQISDRRRGISFEYRARKPGFVADFVPSERAKMMLAKSLTLFWSQMGETLIYSSGRDAYGFLADDQHAELLSARMTLRDFKVSGELCARGIPSRRWRQHVGSLSFYQQHKVVRLKQQTVDRSEALERPPSAERSIRT